MALVRKYGKPDMFLTMTCNPNWDEIKQDLLPGQIAQDHPDLVTRVFRAKLEELKKKLMENNILGKGHDRASVAVREGDNADGNETLGCISMGKDIKTFPLPEIDEMYDDSNGIPREIFEEASVEVDINDVSLVNSLNSEQMGAYEEIMATIDSNKGRIFFVDGPSGIGKTSLYRSLLATQRSQNKLAVATTTSGVAASIMPGGRTAHSRFKIPLTIENGSFCSFTKQSGTAKLLRQASLIIWDETSMTKRQVVEALDNNVRDIMDRPQLPFGAKTVVFGGDFRQGQTIPNVGVYLPEPVFSHGQLYVAKSRATSRKNIKILAKPPNAIEEDDEPKKSKKKGNKNGKEKTKKNEKKNVPTGNVSSYFKEKMDGESKRYDSLLDSNSEPCSIPLDYLRNITNNFSDDQLLGEGGFGKVYKGVLQSGKMIAVKKFNHQAQLVVEEKQFENEVYHLMNLKHPNIVRFVGYCYQTQHECVEHNGRQIFAETQRNRLLCLEYLPKGSLDRHLSDGSSGHDWKTRYKIIKGICCGLRYLHEECRCEFSASIIHLDLKPANILLDDNMVPKIADFGLSRLFEDNKTHTIATFVAGTDGYMAPEYFMSRIVTTKADIYSLGVIIMEIITGSKIHA
ncbi:homeodomain-interacting protein kinase 2-like [Panicum virgatum]|uniref:homeodomain-interacting protein kinase 2-like n=1 Tax=Panicum virgatum TaxID=38727 RepID=UPI0019D5A918|nr:homeodomain-interacting protein kinase 2-like [Panicum virgatum]